MSIEEQAPMTEQLSKTTSNLDQESLLALVSVRPPTPDKCAVCLNNKQNDIIARIDSCSHTFCFPCVLEWSKVRAICPLCKQPFTVITRERYSGELIEEIRVQTTQRSSAPPIRSFSNLNDVLNWIDHNHTRSNDLDTHNRNDIFRQMVYIEWLNTVQSVVRRPNVNAQNSNLASINRTTNALTTASWSNLIPLDSIRHLLNRYLRQTTSELRESTIYSQSTRQTVAFRKYIYLNRLYVNSPLVGHNRATLTVRECSPTWYASNPACLHRLVPFLARELFALLWNDEATIEVIIQEILTAIQTHEIRSSFLTRKLNTYLRRYTKHFIHEFYTFARCPYDLAGFDRHAQYPAMNTAPVARPPIQISLDDDHDDGNEQTPIVLDENSDMSIDLSDSTSHSSESSLSTMTIESERQSTSSECEIVEYVEPTRERTPTLIVLSEDEDHVDNPDTVQSHAAASTKRKHRHHRHSHKRSRQQQLTTSVADPTSPISVILDDDDDNDEDSQQDISNQEQLQQQQQEDNDC
ncbi:unnamed protein product [Adineta ricciae]|uniref:RING-type E3 ubiquitin transferase n=1 Tax=Adineta ricciae TaxID=249248 RepID=A0A813MTN7_ADIRI|nr:unnamed protein product [Adineta ricciae]CAF1226140.1 unnamed protein product [Adineta ricciae]